MPNRCTLRDFHSLTRHFTGTLCTALVCTALCWASAQDNATLIGVAEQTPDFSTLLNALETAGLTDTLQGPGPFTVFAPTNEAFDKLPDRDLSDLLADQTALRRVLDYHIVHGSYTTSDIGADLRDTGFTTLLGDTLPITESGVGNATVTTVNIPASNGVLYAIDTVLTPPAAPLADAPETDATDTEPAETDTNTQTEGTDTQGQTETPDSSDDSRTRIALSEVEGSSISGSVLIADFSNDRAIATLTLTGTPPGSEHPAAIYEGGCAALPATPLAELEPYVSDIGFSTTVLALPYRTLIGAPHAVAILASPGDATVVACGEVGQ